MKFAKHVAKAMNVSDPEWFPYWINYKHLKKFLKLSLVKNRTIEVARASSPPSTERGEVEGSHSNEDDRQQIKKQARQQRNKHQITSSGEGRPWKRLRGRYGNTNSVVPPKTVRCSLTSIASGLRRNGAAHAQSGLPNKTNSGTTTDFSIGASSSTEDLRYTKSSVPCAGTPDEEDEDECPFFGALLREVDKCSTFFIENEEDLKVRVQRLQVALYKLKDPALSRLSSVKDCHVKLMQACVNFYRDALLLEDFAMVNYTAVMKLLKKRDKIGGTADKMDFMAEVMAEQPFAMYPGVASRVAQVECIFKEIENMCFIRTDGGMKSLMRAELPAVEAILQLARESQNVQDMELRGTDSTAAAPASAASSTHHPFGSCFGESMLACCGYGDSRAVGSAAHASSGAEAAGAGAAIEDAARGIAMVSGAAGPPSKASNSSSDSESSNGNGIGHAGIRKKGKRAAFQKAVVPKLASASRPGFLPTVTACNGGRMSEGRGSAEAHRHLSHGIAKIASEMQEPAVSHA